MGDHVGGAWHRKMKKESSWNLGLFGEKYKIYLEEIGCEEKLDSSGLLYARVVLHLTTTELYA